MKERAKVEAEAEAKVGSRRLEAVDGQENSVIFGYLFYFNIFYRSRAKDHKIQTTKVALYLDN